MKLIPIYCCDDCPHCFDIFKVRSDRASASAAAASLASSLVMDYIDLYLCHSDQAAVEVAAASLAMTLGFVLGLIWIFDASDAADADARSERALILTFNGIDLRLDVWVQFLNSVRSLWDICGVFFFDWYCAHRLWL